MATSVAVSGATIVVGSAATGPDGRGAGAAYVYTPDGIGGYSEVKLVAPDGASDDGFGSALAVSGSSIIVGAPFDDHVGVDSGSIYVFKAVGSGGYSTAKYVASDGAAGDHYGASVASDGSTIVVGAPGDDDTGQSAGSAYILTSLGAGSYRETKLLAFDGAASDGFGAPVAVSDGKVLVGASGDGDNGYWSGSAYLYTPNGLTTYAETKLIASDGAALDSFGSALAISGQTIAIGAYRHDTTAGDEAGAVYVFSGPPPPLPPTFGMTVLAAPCPIYDTATATGPGLTGPLPGNEFRTISVTGPLPAGQGVGVHQCVPADATAVTFTISAVDPLASGNLRLSPAGIVPNGGVVNYAATPLNNVNTVTVPLSDLGQVDVFANVGGTGVRLVAIGYSSRLSTLWYNGLTPCAAADSRPSFGSTGAFAGPFAAGAAYPNIDVVGTFSAGQGGGNTDCGVPAGADAVIINLVAVKASGGSGFLSVSPGSADPFEPATPFAEMGMNNAATMVVPLHMGETIAIDIDALTGAPSTHVRVVVLGYLDDAGDGYFPLTGCAAFDSRPGFGASGSFLGERAAGSATTYQITGRIPAAQGGNGGDCGVPAGAKAVLINLVAVQPVTEGNFRAYATGSTPTGGVLNFGLVSPPLNNSNAVVVPLSAIGQLDLFTNTAFNDGAPSTHARGVVLGYYR